MSADVLLYLEGEENLYRMIRNHRPDGGVIVQNHYRCKGNDDVPAWEMEYLTFPVLEALPCVRHLFTTRTGGVSKGIYESLNLSFTRGDDPAAVLENFDRVAQVLGTKKENIVCSDQTHTDTLRIVTENDAGKGVVRERDYTDVDGLITREKGIVLATFFADCVPLFFVDPVKEVIALSHSGWRGTVAEIGKKTVERMQGEFGCDPSDIRAAIGPSICRDCYEVSSDVVCAFKTLFSGQEFYRENNAFAQVFYQKDERQKQEGKYQLDLWKANELILRSAGILPEHLDITDVCTAHNPDYLFSHRITNGKRGNLGAFLMLR